MKYIIYGRTGNINVSGSLIDLHTFNYPKKTQKKSPQLTLITIFFFLIKMKLTLNIFFL